MQLRINIAISILALMTIWWAVRFAVAQERRRDPGYLPGAYQLLNDRFIEGSLPPVQIEWSDLTHDDFRGETYLSDDGFVILVDKNMNLFNGELEDTIQHETCHVATWEQEPNPHGAQFKACMDRVKADKH